MTHNIAPIGKAMTAIAAALVLVSAHPSHGQTGGASPAPASEVPADAATAADPLAPEPVAQEAPATDAALPPPPPAPKPKVETAAAKPAKASAAPAAARSSARRASPPAAIAAPVAPAPAEPVTTADPTPIPAQPTATAEPVAPAPVAESAPASGMAGLAVSDLMADERLPYAGGAALGLLALGGAGLVSRRRKRRRENEAFEARQQFLDQAEAEVEPPVLELGPADEKAAGPAFARRPAPIHDPVPAKAPTTKLPEDFDLSRFGRHVQAAYRGPTADNPSLSLKYRLRRATALDQQERRQAEQAKGAREAPAPLPERGNWESRPDADFLFRRTDKSAERESQRL